MKEARKSKLPKVVRSLGSSAFGQLVTVLLQLLTAPVFIYCIGVASFGEWIVLSTIPAFLFSADFGLASAGANAMQMAAHKHEKERCLAIYHSVCLAIVLLLGAVCLLVLGLISVLDLPHLLNLAQLSRSECNLILGMLLVQVCCSNGTSLQLAAYRALDRYATGLVWLHSSRAITNIALMVALLLKFTLVQSVVISMTATVTVLAANRIHLNVITDWLHPGFKRAAMGELRPIIAPSLASFLYPLTESFNNLGIRVATGILLNPTAVAVLATHQLLARSVFLIVRFFRQGMLAEVAKAALEDANRLFKYLRLGAVVSFWLPALALLGLFISGPFFFPIWTLHKVHFDPILFLLVAVAYLFGSMWYMHLAIPLGTNRHVGFSVRYLLLTLFGQASFYLTLRFVGLTSAVLSITVVDFLSFLVVAKLVKQICGFGIEDFGRALIYDPPAAWQYFRSKVRLRNTRLVATPNPNFVP